VSTRFTQLGILIAMGWVFAGPVAGSEQKGKGAQDVKAVPSATLVAAAPDAMGETPGSTSRDDGSGRGSSAELSKPPGKSQPSRAEITAMVERLARRHRLDIDLVHAVIRAESGYNPNAVSHAGAVGLMQVMPATASDYGVRSVDALFDPTTNLDTGMRHFRRLLDKYGSIGQAVMAYNAGEGALERSGGFVSYPETQRYTHAVVLSYLRKKGVEPYTSQARQAVGIDVTPAMASASSGSNRHGAAPNAAGAPVEGRAPVTRLSSRLSPRLSRRTEADAASVAASSHAAPAVLNQGRLRFAGDAR
jgi:hypothetical protein